MTTLTMQADSRAEMSARPARRPLPSFVWLVRVLLLFLLVAAAIFGSSLVRIAAITAGVLAIWGDCEGGVRHLVRLSAAWLALWMAPTLGPPIGNWLTSQFGIAAATARGGGILLAGVGVVVAAGLGARIVSALLKRHPLTNGINRACGGLLGTAEGGLIVATICWMTLAFEKPLTALQHRAADNPRPPPNWMFAAFNAVQATVHDDPAGQWLAAHNPLRQIRAVDTASRMAEVAGNPEAVKAVLDDRRIKDFLELPVVQRHLSAFQNDAGLRDAMRRRDMTALLQSRQFVAMLNDGELYNAVTDNWTELSDALAGIRQ